MKPLPISLCALALVLAAFAAPAAAQVPLDYVLVSEQQPTTTDPVLHYVHPRHGHAAAVVPGDIRWVRPSLTSIALDPADPTKLYAIGGLSVSIAQQVKVLGVQNGELTSQTLVTVGGAARLKRLAIYQGTLLYTATGTQAGLYQVPLSGGTPTLLVPLADAVDLTVLGSKVYANSYTAGSSTIVEYDLVANTSRTVGTVPGVQCLTVSGNTLIAGTDVGDILGIDPNTGNSGVLISTGKSNHIAIGVLYGTLFVFATDREVWTIADLQKPLYTAAGPIKDFELGVHALPSFFTYGKGCTGTGGQGPHFQFVNLPALGNSTFSLAVQGGLGSSPAVLLIGVSRTQLAGAPLPLKLDPIGMIGCELLTAPIADAAILLDPAGAGSVVLPVPGNPVLIGAELAVQWFVIDAGANPLGISASEGAVAIVR